MICDYNHAFAYVVEKLLMQSHTSEQPTYFTYYDIDPSLYKPKQNLIPALVNKKITEQGELVLANIYQQFEDKQALIALAGSGRLYYSLFKKTAKPDSAEALQEFSRAQLDQFKWEYYKISTSLTFKKICLYLQDLAFHLLQNPFAFISIFVNLSLIVAAFQTKASASNTAPSASLLEKILTV